METCFSGVPGAFVRLIVLELSTFPPQFLKKSFYEIVFVDCGNSCCDNSPRVEFISSLFVFFFRRSLVKQSSLCEMCCSMKFRLLQPKIA